MAICEKNSAGLDILRLVGEISCWVAQISIADLPRVLGSILDGVLRVVGLNEGAISLFDDVFGEVHVLEKGDVAAPRLRRIKISDACFPSSVLDGLSKTSSHQGSGPTVFASDSSSLMAFDLSAGSHRLGALYIVSRAGSIHLNEERECGLDIFVNLATLALDSCRRQGGTLQWLDALSGILYASRTSRNPEDVRRLLREIVDIAIRVSRADFVVLYEYFEEFSDVRLPPIVAGQVLDMGVLQGRGVAAEHRSSAIFRLLCTRQPFYAERASEDWADAGLSNAGDGGESFFERECVVSSAGVPLCIEGECVGIIFFNFRERKVFSNELREHLELFSDQAALAIGNARFFLRSERYNRNLEIINQIGRELGSAVSRDISQIGDLIYTQTYPVIPTRNFFLCLYDNKKNQFYLPYVRDEYDSAEVLGPRLHEGLTAYVCATGKALCVSRTDQGRLFAEGKAKLVGNPSAVWLGAPLILRDKVIGALVVQDYHDEEAFNEEHLRLLAAIAIQAAIAVDNHRLLREAGLRLEELSALLEMSQAFGVRHLTLDSLFSSVLNRLCGIALCSGSLLLLLDASSKIELDSSSKAKLRVVASSSGLVSYLGKTVHEGEGVSGRVLCTGEPFIVNNYSEWPARCCLFDPPPRRVCAVPLFWEGDVMGVLTLSSESEVGAFSGREIEILQRFAGPVAAAVQNARDKSFRNALVHAVPNAIIAVDGSGSITEFNREAAHLFDARSGKLLGEKIDKLYWRGFADSVEIQNLLSKNGSGKIRDKEVFGRSKSGEKIPLSLSAALLRDDVGDIIGSVGIFEDLRVQALRGRTQLLVDAIREISSQEDLREIAERVVAYATALLYAEAGCLFLREGDAFKVQFYDGYNDPEFSLQAQVVADRLRDLAKENPRQIIFLVAGGDVDSFRLLAESRSAIVVPIRTDSLLLGFLLIESRKLSHFIGDQKMAEVLASQAAASINRVQLLYYREQVQRHLLVSANAIAVGQIATTFIHEAKNSLNSLGLAVHSLHEDIERESGLRAKKDYMDRLDVVKSEINRFDELSRRLQRFTHQGLVPQKGEVFINQVVRRTVQLLVSGLRAKGMKKEVRLDPSLEAPAKGRGHPITVDEYQVQQVLMNLILNAIAASSERGKILIETKNQDDVVEINVTDYGVGISSEARKRIFTPFFTTKEDGVGLGLYLSRILIEVNHGGTIEVVGGVSGKGTTFSVRLPRSSDQSGDKR